MAESSEMLYPSLSDNHKRGCTKDLCERMNYCLWRDRKGKRLHVAASRRLWKIRPLSSSPPSTSGVMERPQSSLLLNSSVSAQNIRPPVEGNTATLLSSEAIEAQSTNVCALFQGVRSGHSRLNHRVHRAHFSITLG